MKTFLTLSILLTLNSFNLFAQWESGVRLSDFPFSSRTSLHNARNIASVGNAVHVVWEDYRFGASGEIYYKRSTDEGLSWGSDMRLTDNFGSSIQVNVAATGQVLHVVWRDSYDGNPEVYYKRSTDGGISWSADTRLTNNSNSTRYPIIAVSGQFVHVAFDDDREGNFEIYYKRSTDEGVSWEAETRMSIDNSHSSFPSIAASGQHVHIVWEDSRNGSNRELYYRRSSDGGINWGAETRLTNDPGKSNFASLASSENNVHVVWNDDRDGNMEIYYKHSIDGGLNWSADSRLTNNPVVSELACVTALDQNVHVVWNDAPGQVEVLYTHSADGGVSWEPQTQLSESSFLSEHSSVSVSDTVVHAVWADFRDGSSYEIYYNRNPTGNVTGIENIGLDFPEEFMLEQNFPNPFNPSTTFKYSIPNSEFVTLKVYDVLGNEVATLVNEEKPAGIYEVEFDASRLSSGVYLYKLSAGDFSDVNKLMLLK